MTDVDHTSEERVYWLCRLIGHKWSPSHVAMIINGVPSWVYTDHVCLRCYKTEWRYQRPIVRGTI